MVRSVGGTRGEIDEERLVRRERFLELHPRNGLVSHVRHEIVAFVVRCGDSSHPVIDRGIPLVGLAAEETVELVESRTGRPAIGRPGDADLPRRRFMVLAEEAGAVTVQAQHLRQRCDVVRSLSRVAREGSGRFGDAAHVVHVVVATGEQRSPRWRTDRGGVELIVAQPVCGKIFGCRHAHRPPESTGHAEAHVVHEDDEYIRRPCGRLDLKTLRRCGIAGVEHCAVRVVRFGDGQHGAVRNHLRCSRCSTCRTQRKAEYAIHSFTLHVLPPFLSELFSSFLRP